MFKIQLLLVALRVIKFNFQFSSTCLLRLVGASMYYFQYPAILRQQQHRGKINNSLFFKAFILHSLCWLERY